MLKEKIQKEKLLIIDKELKKQILFISLLIGMFLK